MDRFDRILLCNFCTDISPNIWSIKEIVLVFEKKYFIDQDQCYTEAKPDGASVRKEKFKKEVLGGGEFV